MRPRGNTRRATGGHLRSRPVAVLTTLAAVAVGAAGLAGCTSPWAGEPDGSAGSARPEPAPTERVVKEPRPKRFTIVPDDYHVPWAGTAGDGRKFFLSNELFDVGGSSYVGLFLWNADGTFDEVRVTDVARPGGLPPGQAGAAGPASLVRARLAELGDYELEPIEVAPFTTKVDGVTFGWHFGRYDDGTAYLNIEPGDFIAYYAPWDGYGYDT